MHPPDQVDQDAEIKAAFLEAYEDMPILDAAAKKVGRAYVTIWRMRQADPEFDAAVEAKKAHADDRRYQMVEDSLTVDCIKGNHKGGERMFLLVNMSRRRNDARWKNIRHVEQQTTIIDKRDDESAEELSEEELLASREDILSRAMKEQFGT